LTDVFRPPETLSIDPQITTTPILSFPTISIIDWDENDRWFLAPPIHIGDAFLPPLDDANQCHTTLSHRLFFVMRKISLMPIPNTLGEIGYWKRGCSTPHEHLATGAMEVCAPIIVYLDESMWSPLVSRHFLRRCIHSRNATYKVSFSIPITTALTASRSSFSFPKPQPANHPLTYPNK
jgi:hypothetical protein